MTSMEPGQAAPVYPRGMRTAARAAAAVTELATTLRHPFKPSSFATSSHSRPPGQNLGDAHLQLDHHIPEHRFNNHGRPRWHPEQRSSRTLPPFSLHGCPRAPSTGRCSWSASPGRCSERGGERGAAYGGGCGVARADPAWCGWEWWGRAGTRWQAEDGVQAEHADSQGQERVSEGGARGRRVLMLMRRALAFAGHQISSQ